eukprot:TRINITY_DN4588_c0_g1_i3.p1 TRINITY_DN4588_c0_g1~~TRINITY_DN4588_c0_g1_i3.p1  ORF type:complete len:131 (+),score=16.00 TRINITY_DN4588_c0_g1_i3:47-439(+)
MYRLEDDEELVKELYEDGYINEAEFILRMGKIGIIIKSQAEIEEEQRLLDSSSNIPTFKSLPLQGCDMICEFSAHSDDVTSIHTLSVNRRLLSTGGGTLHVWSRVSPPDFYKVKTTHQFYHTIENAAVTR